MKICLQLIACLQERYHFIYTLDAQKQKFKQNLKKEACNYFLNHI